MNSGLISQFDQLVALSTAGRVLTTGRVLLVDADSSIPNLALMKLSAYLKSIGVHVDLVTLNIPYYPSRRKKEYLVDTTGYDQTVCSCIFNKSWQLIRCPAGGQILFGGTGSDNKHVLPVHIDSFEPDYSLYPDNDIAYGFISRGCNRKCYFCVVPEKEGRTRQVSNIGQIIGGFKKVKFMDNNFLQLPNHIELLQELVSKKIRCQFNQGLDIRLITTENSALLRRLKYIGEFTFAFDDYGYRAFIENRLKLLPWRRGWQFRFFIYTHPDMSHGEVVKRVLWCKRNECLPYVMRDVTCAASAHAEFYNDIAAYANQPSIFKKMDFDVFLSRRHGRQSRIDASLSKWNSGLAEVERKIFQIENAIHLENVTQLTDAGILVPVADSGILNDLVQEVNQYERRAVQSVKRRFWMDLVTPPSASQLALF